MVCGLTWSLMHTGTILCSESHSRGKIKYKGLFSWNLLLRPWSLCSCACTLRVLSLYLNGNILWRPLRKVGLWRGAVYSEQFANVEIVVAPAQLWQFPLAPEWLCLESPSSWKNTLPFSSSVRVAKVVRKLRNFTPNPSAPLLTQRYLSNHGKSGGIV